MTQPNEEWLPLARHPDYDVSNLGRVRSWRNPGKTPGRAEEPRLLTPYSGAGRYLQVTLATPYRHKRYVHHLVAETFLGPRPAGADIAHWDGNGANNAVENLRYATVAENMADKVRHGTTNRGERCGTRKLERAEVEMIRDLYGPYRYNRKGAVTQRELGKMFGISQQQVNRIVSKNHWIEETSR